MDNQCNGHILEALKMADDLMELADNGGMLIDDTGCDILFGVMRDCAYEIRMTGRIAAAGTQNKIDRVN